MSLLAGSVFALEVCKDQDMCMLMGTQSHHQNTASHATPSTGGVCYKYECGQFAFPPAEILDVALLADSWNYQHHWVLVPALTENISPAVDVKLLGGRERKITPHPNSPIYLQNLTFLC